MQTTANRTVVYSLSPNEVILLTLLIAKRNIPCTDLGKFPERVIQELCKLKKVRLKGDFYSPEFNRKFRDENAAFSFGEDKNRKGHYHICVNDIPLVQ